MKPILFNAEMVRAILESRKTVTRRVVKFYKNRFTEKVPSPDDVTVNNAKVHNEKIEFYEEPFFCFDIRTPYQPGDILYVRETWTYHENADGGIIFKARCAEKLAKSKKWHPSIHMPKEAARIFLRVTDVRVERLQDITDEQARKEGAEPLVCPNCYGVGCSDCAGSGYIEPALLNFIHIWNTPIKKSDRDRYGWDANPWVWVIEFERISKEEAKNA